MISVQDVYVTYEKRTPALRGVTLDFHEGEFVGVIGLSGSGKSTLLKTLNRLVSPSEGRVIVEGKDLSRLSFKELRDIRRGIGFVFQEFNLVDRSSVLENVLIGRLGYQSSVKSFFGIFKEGDYRLAEEALETVGLGEKIFERGDRLSGGQKQRVAIAKTLAQEPRVILADEPVASLDQNSGKVVMDTFKRIQEKHGISIIVNLHDVKIARAYCDRLVGLKDGKILFDQRTKEISDEDITGLYR
ncbi:phosphonate ABC transporter ATP-binding protein [Isachenkonia alkalipeptolytica]|uniref:Phosphonate ABC transporter ATP-binding protein n=1 Tax=Isachenkonia alkalipeptolytica TaxID=2565777 RepID=A0AA44BCR2_9CLOT|nr:phosphonate ABC transporter ATP-binding protein [Isachenkonia alkalipeptolytica]NBG87267.1 phosphonate ABC transporter ATP-binding protein [Isachenkonia alkalipeptolytica]